MHERIYFIGIFTAIITIFTCMIFFISKSVVQNGVQDIELRYAQEDMSQLYALIGAAKLRMKQHTYDWSSWDEAYDFIENRDDNFIVKNLNHERLEELHITGAALYDLDKNRLAFIDGSRIFFGEEWLESEVLMFDKIANLAYERNVKAIEGFVNVSGVGMIFSAHKIYDSMREKPSRGYLIMASALDIHFKERARSVSGLQFSFLPIDLYNEVYAEKTHGNNFKLLKTDGEIRVYSIVNDIFDKPAFCLEIIRKRDIAEFGKQISNKNFLLMLSLCITVLLAGVTLLAFANRRFLRKEMEYKTKHDRLTGLPNSMLFRERLSELFKKVRNNGKSLAIIYIDVDKFKNINDSYGYQKGDLVLCEIANRLQILNPYEILARTNADKFLLAIPAANDEVIVDRAQKILEILNQPITVEGDNLHLSSSVGLAYLAADCPDSVTLIHHAEIAMYDAKHQGGNVISFYEKRMGDAASSRKKMETALYEAVEKEAFTVYYQPKVDISKIDVAGCEALVRWKTDKGWVPPPAFIPIAEETGLVTQIDMLVLRTACKQALAWQKDGSGAVPIAVNMSVHSILSEGFADQVIRILDEEGTPTSLIDIEITETSFMSDMDKAFAAISRLHEAGIHVALDDFGTGYSSLQYLSAMPISFLKIDKKFVDDIFSGKVTAQPLVKSILALAANLGMHTICEGVEDKNQLAFLVGNGAHIIQGYLFSKPLSTADCGEFLRNRKAHIEAVLQAS